MAKTDQVPVFYRDQDDACDHPAHVWLREKCRQAKNMLGKFENHGNTFRLFALQPKTYPITAAMLKTSNHLPAASTISMGELLANVGIAGSEVGFPAPRNVVKRAQQKIRAYPNVHDDQAVVAFGRWYNSSAIQSLRRPVIPA